MKLTPSLTDLEFRDAFESGAVAPSSFRHRDHLRLAYVYLCEGEVETAHKRMRNSIRRFLDLNGVDPAKYHETLTLAWIQAVRHFMEMSSQATSFDDFIEHDQRLLDTSIMLTHYSKNALFSDRARKEFLAPDRQAIPLYRPLCIDR
jgi:hypothetical protein